MQCSFRSFISTASVNLRVYSIWQVTPPEEKSVRVCFSAILVSLSKYVCVSSSTHARWVNLLCLFASFSPYRSLLLSLSLYFCLCLSPSACLCLLLPFDLFFAQVANTAFSVLPSGWPLRLWLEESTGGKWMCIPMALYSLSWSQDRCPSTTSITFRYECMTEKTKDSMCPLYIASHFLRGSSNRANWSLYSSEDILFYIFCFCLFYYQHAGVSICLHVILLLSLWHSRFLFACRRFSSSFTSIGLISSDLCLLSSLLSPLHCRTTWMSWMLCWKTKQCLLSRNGKCAQIRDGNNQQSIFSQCRIVFAIWIQEFQ